MKFRLFVLLALALMGWWSWHERNRVLSVPMSSWEVPSLGDCAVVFTGGPGRVPEGFDLLRSGRVKKLLVMGVYEHSELRDIFPQIHFMKDIDDRDVVLERYSRTTYGNAVQSLPLIESLRCRSLVLVTSQLHMYRSKRTLAALLGDQYDLTGHPVFDPTRSSLGPVQMEVLKSMFYSVWAY